VADPVKAADATFGTMASEAEMLAVLEAQRAWFASDDHIKERAAIGRDATPEECLEAVAELCTEAALFLSRLSEAELDRALIPEPCPRTRSSCSKRSAVHRIHDLGARGRAPHRAAAGRR